MQRCPEWLPKMFDPWIRDPKRMLLLDHEKGVQVSPTLTKVYPNILSHDPRDIHRAREVASQHEPLPVGILYRDETAPVYEEVRQAGQLRPAARIQTGLEAEFDKFTIWPDGDPRAQA